MDVTTGSLALVVITLLAATVNGALGYGFSSITVPVALLFYTNRILNPALVWVEVPLNAYVLWLNRASIPNVWRRVRSEEHTSELQSLAYLVCRLLLEKKKRTMTL